MADGLIEPAAGAAPPDRPPGERPRGRPRAGAPHPIDVAFGARVRARRILLGISQERLGELLGLTFQQVQKYETGANRVSVSRAYAIADALHIPVADLVAGGGAASPDVTVMAGGASDRATLEIAKAIAGIVDPEIRKRLHALAKACTNTGKDAGNAAV